MSRVIVTLKASGKTVKFRNVDEDLQDEVLNNWKENSRYSYYIDPITGCKHRVDMEDTSYDPHTERQPKRDGDRLERTTVTVCVPQSNGSICKRYIPTDKLQDFLDKHPQAKVADRQ